MAQEQYTNAWRELINEDPECTNRFFKWRAPQVLRQYDRHVLGGYDIGREFRFYLQERIPPELGGVAESYSGICRTVFDEFHSIALKNTMPSLPVERVNKSEMHLYAVRYIFTSLLSKSRELVLQKKNGAPIGDDVLRSYFAVINEIFVTMKHATSHSKNQRRGRANAR